VSVTAGGDDLRQHQTHHQSCGVWCVSPLLEITRGNTKSFIDHMWRVVWMSFQCVLSG
jgi:hypothetical protein